MIPPKKILSIVLILVLAASSPFFLQSTTAVSKPSVPEFTIKFVNATIPTPTIDPYTGESHTILTGNYSVEVKISNQATGGLNGQIYYNIRIKPHYDGSWAELYGLWNHTSEANSDGTFTKYISEYAPARSNSEHTTITLEIQIANIWGKTGTYFHIPSYSADSGYIPEGGEVDFQVQSLVGHSAEIFVSDHQIAMPSLGYYRDAVAFDVASDWSNTQTITMGTSAPSETSTAQPEATSQPITDGNQNGIMGINWMEIALFAALAVIIGLLVVIVRMQKRINQKNGDGNHE